MDHSLAKYTVRDVERMENHAELVNGELVITDRTTAAHNNAVLEIASALRRFVKENGGECRVYAENIALYCDELSDEVGNFFLPDVMVVCGTEGMRDDGVHIAPRFVAEVTSEATRKNDYGRKMVTYGEIGVEEYWVVDLQKQMVVHYLASNDFAPEIISYANNSKASVLTYPPLEIELAGIFE